LLSVGSAIDALINHGIDIGAKPTSIDSRRTRGRIGNGSPRHEPVRPEGPQLRDGSTVARDDDRSTRLYLAKDSGGFIAKFSLGDCSAHGPT